MISFLTPFWQEFANKPKFYRLMPIFKSRATYPKPGDNGWLWAGVVEGMGRGELRFPSLVSKLSSLSPHPQPNWSTPRAPNERFPLFTPKHGRRCFGQAANWRGSPVDGVEGLNGFPPVCGDGWVKRHLVTNHGLFLCRSIYKYVQIYKKCYDIL